MIERAASSERCRLSLEGLSLGDAFGQKFFAPSELSEDWIARKVLPPAPWYYTDDTVMALSIVEVLEQRGTIDQDLLARLFAAKYDAEVDRGYGAGARGLLEAIGRGGDWRVLSPGLFGGQGSAGNGGAMRAAPLGAFFADDLERVVTEARRSAEVTHAHADGQAGGIAVALAAAHAARGSRGWPLLEAVLAGLPESATRSGIEKALSLAHFSDPRSAAAVLGNGTGLLARDTVPFALWCVAKSDGSLEDALWATVVALGDRDTTCAIVGGIYSLVVGSGRVPLAWLSCRESLVTLAGVGWSRA